MPASRFTSSLPAPVSFRFRPRFRNLALGSMAFGATLLAGGLLTTGAAGMYAIIGGAAGVVLGLLYLLSPAWRLIVTVDNEALQVTRGGQLRFRLPWAEVVQVIASPDTKTCFVDGGTPGRSFLVPGPGASASYDIEDRDVLYAMIMEHVEPARIEWVDLIEHARQARAAGRGMVPPLSDGAGAGYGAEPAPGADAEHEFGAGMGATGPGAEAGAGAEAGTDAGAEAGADATSDRESGK